MADIMEIARRHAGRRQNENDEFDELCLTAHDLISSHSSISYSIGTTAPAPAEEDDSSHPITAKTWGCHLQAVRDLLARGDELIEELGVSGTHPIVARAAQEVASAIVFGDFPTLRHSVGEFMYAVRCAAHLNRIGGEQHGYEADAEPVP